MDVIRHDDVPTDAPEIRRFPTVDNALRDVFIRKQPFASMRANCQKNNDRTKTRFHGWKMSWRFSSIAFEWRRRLEERALRAPELMDAAELRPPVGSAFIALTVDRPLPACERACRYTAIEW